MTDLEQILERLRVVADARAIAAPETVVDGRAVAVRCHACLDRGWVTVPDDGAGAAVRCACRLPPFDGPGLRAKLKSAGLEAEEIEAAHSRWDDRHQARPDWARSWLSWALTGAEGPTPEGVLGGAQSPWCLALIGMPGAGKTKTAATLMRIYVAGGGERPVWARVPELYDRVMCERALEGSSSYERRVEAAGLLVLDEAGREHRRRRATEPESALDMMVGEIVMRRHRRRLLTVLTANLRLADIGDGAVESRIREGCYREMGSAHGDFRDWRSK